MITVIARWDTTQLPCETEWRMYRQLKGAFNVDRIIFTAIDPTLISYGGFEQFGTMEEAIASCIGERVFLEPTGVKSLSEIPVGDIVLVVGNTNQNNLSSSLESERYKINSPAATELYGVNAAAIALAHRVN